MFSAKACFSLSVFRVILFAIFISPLNAFAEQCLALPPQPVSFGQFDQSLWADLTGLTAPEFLSSSEDLAITLNGSSTAALRQRMVPSSKGSPRVVALSSVSAANSYNLTQSVYLEPGFEWGGSKEGGKFGFGFGGGSAPSGGDLDSKGFTARFMWRGNGDGSARLALYSYAADRRQNLPYGDDYDVDGFDVPVGQWFTLRMELDMNTAWSAANGAVRVWVDNQLKLDKQGVTWQSERHDTNLSNFPEIQYLSYAGFYGGSSSDWAPSKTTYIQFANVCWEAQSASTDDEITDAAPENSMEPEPVEFGDLVGDDYHENSSDASYRTQLIALHDHMQNAVPSSRNRGSSRLEYASKLVLQSLAPDQWIDEARFAGNSNSISVLEQAMRKLESAIESATLSRAVTAEVRSIELELAQIMKSIAERELAIAGDEVAENGCSVNATSISDQCEDAFKQLERGASSLQSLMQDLDNPYEVAYHAEKIWKYAVRAIEELYS